MTGYVKDVAERVVSTAAQAFLAYVGTDAVLDVLAFDWKAAGSITAGAAVLALVKALAVRPIGNPETGSVVS